MEQQGFFNADNGNKSYSRLSGFLLVLAYIIWGTYITYVKDSIPDIPTILAGTVLTLYGINKVLSKSTKEPQSNQEEQSNTEETK
jgi:hypothetical protein